jgi:hypothetical protein
MMSADMNITQGDNSFMAGAIPAFAVAPAASDAGATTASVEAALGIAAAGAAAAGAAVDGAGGAIALGCAVTAGAAG